MKLTPTLLAALVYTYERLAPRFGYETRLDTRQFDANTPNGKLMIAVAGEILASLDHAAPDAMPDPQKARTIMESDTPRTDSMIDEIGRPGDLWDFARQLERENALLSYAIGLDKGQRTGGRMAAITTRRRHENRY